MDEFGFAPCTTEIIYRAFMGVGVFGGRDFDSHAADVIDGRRLTADRSGGHAEHGEGDGDWRLEIGDWRLRD